MTPRAVARQREASPAYLPSTTGPPRRDRRPRGAAQGGSNLWEVAVHKALAPLPGRAPVRVDSGQ
jgi:hypothetical protein